MGVPTKNLGTPPARHQLGYAMGPDLGGGPDPGQQNKAHQTGVRAVAVRQDGIVLQVRYKDGGYMVAVGPPHTAETWSSPGPLTPTEVLAELSKRGCHSTEATDALDATGMDWRPVHDAEVLRRRSEGSGSPGA